MKRNSNRFFNSDRNNDPGANRIKFGHRNGIFVLPYERNKARDNPIENSTKYSNKFVDLRSNRDRILDEIGSDEERDMMNGSMNGSMNTPNSFPPDTNYVEDQIYSQTYISYIQVNSADRKRISTNIYAPKLFNLPPDPIRFTHGSTLIEIIAPDHFFKPNQTIRLNNIMSKNVILKDAISVKKNSAYARIEHPHQMSLYGLIPSAVDIETVDFVEKLHLDSVTNPRSIVPDSKQYYLFVPKCRINDLSVRIDGLDGNMVGNIPVNYLNATHVVYLLGTKSGNTFELVRNAYVIKLLHKSNINHRFCATVYVRYNNLYGIPLNCLHTNLLIASVEPGRIIIDVGVPAIVDPVLESGQSNECVNYGGGAQSYVRLVTEILQGYPNPDTYEIVLDKVYRNVIGARVVSSIFPNSIRAINSSNNKLSWRNMSDGNHLYSISLSPATYTAHQLEIELERLFAQTPRIRLGTGDNFANELNHMIKVSVGPETSEVEFRAYKQYKLKHRIIPIYNRVRLELNDKFRNLIQSLDLIYLVVDKKNVYCCQTKNHELIGSLAPDKAVLMNFWIRARDATTQKIKSIGSTTVLENFIFNQILNIVTLNNHLLTSGDLLVTDQFDSEHSIYEISSIIDSNSFRIKKISCGKFSYGNIFIGCKPCRLDLHPHNIIVLDENIIDKIIPIGSDNLTYRIKHPNHNISDRSIIYIGNDNIDDHGLKCIVNRIIDDEHYEIVSENKLEQFNPIITYPDIIQLDFTEENTLGTVLGFEKKLTPYAHILTNYADGATPATKLTYADLFFYIRCPELAAGGIPYFTNVLPATDVFAEGRWFYNDYNGISFDSVVPTERIFNPPIDVLTSLHIQIVGPDGKPIELYGADHSFVIEMVELYNQPNETDISARINAEIISHRV